MNLGDLFVIAGILSFVISGLIAMLVPTKKLDKFLDILYMTPKK